MNWLRLLALLAFTSAMGCGGSSTDPVQPKLSDDQVKDLMKQGKENIKKERGDRKPGM